MDNKLNCLWKNRKHPENCLNKNHKNEKCHCDLEPCSLYEKRNLIKILKIKLKGRRYNGKI